jgi:hypothetical protein
MAYCESCGKEHDGSYGSGRFCQKSCTSAFATRKLVEKAGKIGTLDLSGKKYGHLLVQEKGPSVLLYHSKTKEESYTQWFCLCDCGFELLVLTDDLQGARRTTCCRRECAFHRPLKYVDPAQSSFHVVWGQYRVNARSKGLDFNISKEKFRELTQQPCYYCAAAPSTTQRGKGKTSDFVYNGVDRVDNRLGYDEKNCVPACRTCNRMKMEMTLESFLGKVAQIYERHISA